MNTFNETTISANDDDFIAQILEKATPLPATFSFTFIVPSKRHVKDFRAAVERQYPDMKHTFIRAVAESCSQQEVQYQAELALSSNVFESRIQSLHKFVEKRSAIFWDWSWTFGSVEDAQSYEQPDNKRLKLRTEFSFDAIELRMALAPYIIQWTDKCADLTADGTRSSALQNGGQDVEFEVFDEAPCLDHLRWLINQVPDMHVAAETLHMAQRYTGVRLPYQLLEEMKPPVSVVEKMLAVAKEVAKFRGGRTSPQHQLVKKLQQHLAGRLA